MIRSLAPATVILMIFSFPAAAHFEEECMDCYEKETITRLPDGQERHDFEAACCDAACFYQDYVVKEEDVGWGCRVSQLPPSYGENADFYGTVCNSSDDDLECPEPEMPLPPPSDEIQHYGSPIILDLGLGNYRLTSIPGGVQFDLRNEGRRRQVAWTRLSFENAFLALDRDGNGRIDNGSELFGDHTPLGSGALAPNGFVALTEFDSNRDGVVDANDPAWQVLLLWTDRNHDGWSSPDELQPIAQSVVTALATEHRLIWKRDQWGNVFRYMSQFRLRDGAHERQQMYYDVYLRLEP